MSELGQDLGRLFEVGFNLGILTWIEQNKIAHNFGNLYRQDLQQIKFAKMLRGLANKEKVISQQHRQIVEKWSTFFLQKGFLAGLNFLPEYFQATAWSKHEIKRTEIKYYQCSFVNDNSIGTHSKDKRQEFRDLLSQLNLEDLDGQKYTSKGEFVNADTVILLQSPKEFRLICIDYSIFSIKSIRDLVDVGNIEVLRSILLSEISYLKSKSVFANLSLDTKSYNFDISESLSNHYTAFKRNDKESVKMIQAGSYAYSFLEFIRQQELISEEKPLTVNIIGYSDRGISSMSVDRGNLDILKTCYHIYKNERTELDIQQSRQNILNLIKRSAIKSFHQGGREFIDKLLDISADGVHEISHCEKISEFQNSVDIISPEIAQELSLDSNLNLRDAHAELVKRALGSDCTNIFLTGNPGIGKTTAITQFLMSKECLEEGFLFIYVSPRTQVNLDIIEKLSNPQTKILRDDRIFTLDTNANLIRERGGEYTVNYSYNQRHGDFQEQSVHFVDRRSESTPQALPLNTLRRKTEDLIEDIGQKNKGVLDSISEAIYTIINRQISNNIVATVSIQSLKKTHNGGDTLVHLQKIFRDIYNATTGKVIGKKRLELAARIKHIFIVIDEITGDESGVSFLDGISRLVNKYGLTSSHSGFNTKIIVADASIVEPDVINQHLSATTAEPNKIFFRKANQQHSQALSYQPFQFNNSPAILINANSYPATALDIKYNVLIEPIKFNNKIDSVKSSLRNSLQEIIIRDTIALMNEQSSQIIVYIQDKGRLVELIEKIRASQIKFEQYQDYLEIHASLSERDKQNIPLYKDKVKVVFMTASASRGLSFPKAQHILVDIPRFEIEKNLMEVIQVIYRGRGDNEIDRLEKQLIFYLAEQAIYYNDDSQIALQESVLSLLNILIILKTSIITRIVGSGQIGQDRCVMVPIGGKSVLAAGQTFSSKMDGLIKQLKKESNRRPQDELLQTVYSNLENLLSSADLVLSNSGDRIQLEARSCQSYLDLRESLTNNFLQLANNSLESLLSFPPLETAYVSGSLLIVPLSERAIEEKYKMRIEQDIRNFSNGQLLKQMSKIRNDRQYPDSLKSALADAIELVNLLSEKPNQTQRFEDNSKYSDLYYAVPLFTFISVEAMSQYFTGDEEEPEDQRFRDILAAYISSLYPVNSILPIGYKYKEFPFLVFRSYCLKDIKSNIFKDKYFLNSTELNLLNLIFAKPQ